MIRLLADENCDRLLVQRPRQLGYDVLYALESLRARPDIELFRLAHTDDRVLITDDLDFAHISKVETQRPLAVILIRLELLARASAIERVASVLKMLEPRIAGNVAVIEPGQVRLRAFESL